MHPCLTPEVVENGEEQRPANRTLAVVAACKSIIRPRMTFGTPVSDTAVLNNENYGKHVRFFGSFRYLVPPWLFV